jgi:hypothetical protein
MGNPWISMESLGSVWGHFGVSSGRFGFTLGSLWGSLFVHSGVSFESLWGNFGSVLVHFGISLKSLWDHFGINSRSVWDESGHPGAIGQVIPTGFGYGYSQFGIPLSSHS